MAGIDPGDRIHNGVIDLSRTCGDQLDLSGAILRCADVRHSRFGDCRFENAVLDESDWTGATLRLCSLDGVRAMNARFDGASIEDSTATAADFSNASLRGAHLTETSFARAVMHEAAFDRADGDGVEFRGADLARASFVGARLDEADFRGADLRGANLSRGRFRSADFRGALLEGTRFDGADCQGAWFDEGSGPNARSEADPAASQGQTFDETILNAMREAIRALPSSIGGSVEQARNLVDGLARSLESLDHDPSRTAEQWQPWIDRLTRVANESPSDVAAILAAICDAPPLQDAFNALDSAGDQPPDAWKPALERLMEIFSSEQRVDPEVISQLFASARTRTSPESS